MTRVYYFTRTGDSRRIARSIAEQTDGTCLPVSDHKKWGGPFGFIRGGYYASSKKALPADYEKPQPGDTVYLCFPIWAGSFPPAVRTFIAEVGRENIIAVPSSKASHLADTAGFVRVLEAVGPDKTIHL